jgi:hypothetical protein
MRNAAAGYVVGGAEEDRTPDLRIANATLSQLSYRPTIQRLYQPSRFLPIFVITHINPRPAKGLLGELPYDQEGIGAFSSRAAGAVPEMF